MPLSDHGVATAPRRGEAAILYIVDDRLLGVEHNGLLSSVQIGPPPALEPPSRLRLRIGWGLAASSVGANRSMTQKALRSFEEGRD